MNKTYFFFFDFLSPNFFLQNTYPFILFNNKKRTNQLKLVMDLLKQFVIIYISYIYILYIIYMHTTILLYYNTLIYRVYIGN